MYLVLSALTSSPISLVAATKASAFSFKVCMLPPVYHHRHKPEPDVYHLVSSHPVLPEPLLMSYSKALLKSIGDRASPCFKPFLRGNLSDTFLPTRTLLYVSVRLIFINLTIS